MPATKKYDEETVARAVRMYRDRLAEGGISARGARDEVGQLLGINSSTLRNWIRRDEELNGDATNVAGGESLTEEVARLRRENARLRRANDILKTSSAYVGDRCQAGVSSRRLRRLS